MKQVLELMSGERKSISYCRRGNFEITFECGFLKWIGCALFLKFIPGLRKLYTIALHAKKRRSNNAFLKKVHCIARGKEVHLSN